MKLRKVFGMIFLLSVVPMFFVVRYGQNNWGFDDIGIWYTVVCAVFFAIGPSAVFVAIVASARAVLPARTGGAGGRSAPDV